MLCTNCGRETPIGAIFCPYCGKRIILQDPRELSGDSDRIVEFFLRLAELGITSQVYYVVRKFQEKQKIMNYQLCEKEGLFSTRLLLAGENKNDLIELRDYIYVSALFADKKIFVRDQEIIISQDSYMIVEVKKFAGMFGFEDEVRKILKEFGLSEYHLDYLLNFHEEKTVAYLPSSDICLAKEYARAIICGYFDYSIEGKEYTSFLQGYADIEGYKSARKLFSFLHKSVLLYKKNKHEESENNQQDGLWEVFESLPEKYGLKESENRLVILNSYTKRIPKDLISPTGLFKFVSFSDVLLLFNQINNASLSVLQKYETALTLWFIIYGLLPNDKDLELLDAVFG